MESLISTSRVAPMTDMKLDEFFFNDSYIKKEIKPSDLRGLTNGKYLRSRLLFLTSNIFHLTDEQVKDLGRIVEMVHNATLTHDDVIDNSHTRRGVPSIPSVINNKKSVLLGDYMLARALHELSDFNNPKLTKELTLTLKELVEGEWIQYENTNPYKITKSLYTTLALKKTGSLFRWCFIAPLVAFNKQEELYPLFSEFGEKLGIIFQMTDDLIDFNPESKKTYGLDFKNNNINYVLLHLGQIAPELEKRFLRTESIEDLTPEEIDYLNQSIKTAKKEIDEYLKRCHELLEIIKGKLNSDNDFTSLNEFSLVLDLIADRVF